MKIKSIRIYMVMRYFTKYIKQIRIYDRAPYISNSNVMNLSRLINCCCVFMTFPRTPRLIVTIVWGLCGLVIYGRGTITSSPHSSFFESIGGHENVTNEENSYPTERVLTNIYSYIFTVNVSLHNFLPINYKCHYTKLFVQRSKSTFIVLWWCLASVSWDMLLV